LACPIGTTTPGISRRTTKSGFPSGISGVELTERSLKQARHFGSEIPVTRSIEAVQMTDTGYRPHLDGGEHIFGAAVLLSTGVEWHRIEVPGLDRLLGRGVLYGASRQEVRIPAESDQHSWVKPITIPVDADHDSWAKAIIIPG
jgi:thioredoxin reductase